MTRPLDKYTDIHTHDASRAAAGSAVVSIEPGDAMADGGTYSVGIHPWHADSADAATIAAFDAMAADSRVVAVGECGFDRLCNVPLDAQHRVFEHQARLAAQLGKPVIIHCVRAFDLLLGEAAKLRPQPGMWIVHGFRGKPDTARQLVRAGIAISLGRKFNPAVVDAVDPRWIYHETDDENPS